MEKWMGPAHKPGDLIQGVTVNKSNPMRMKCDCYVTCRTKTASVMEHSPEKKTSYE